mmetsp:Transcript_45992/g.105367  ORF Transcript_45992/g.105367 Transcript_45992/m.105367 type:complete len:198 (-) Transcript_45992:261-854(-)
MCGPKWASHNSATSDSPLTSHFWSGRPGGLKKVLFGIRRKTPLMWHASRVYRRRRSSGNSFSGLTARGASQIATHPFSPSSSLLCQQNSDLINRLTFVADDPKQVHLWAAALSRLLAIIRQRHSYEQLFGGIAAGAESPRTLAVRLPLMDQLLEQRANALMDSKQRALIAQEMQKRQGTNTALGNTNSARHSEQLSS